MGYRIRDLNAAKLILCVTFHVRDCKLARRKVLRRERRFCCNPIAGRDEGKYLKSVRLVDVIFLIVSNSGNMRNFEYESNYVLILIDVSSTSNLQTL